jgi:PIN domain nuclease of toxin-antitoxin system
MRLLLDTHIFLWFLSGDGKLSAKHRRAIAEPSNDVFLSVASIWEAIIKFQLGKLALPQSPEILMPVERDSYNIGSLAIDERSISYLAQLPALHSDPFDRIILAQALQYGLTIVTADRQMLTYPVPTLPA